MPGQRVLAVTPNGASSIATERVRPIMPLLEAEYSAVAGKLVFPAIDEILIIDPDCWACMMGATAWLDKKMPVRFVASVFCHWAKGTSAMGVPE